MGILWKILGVAILLLVPLAWGLGVDWLFARLGRTNRTRTPPSQGQS